MGHRASPQTKYECPLYKRTWGGKGLTWRAGAPDLRSPVSLPNFDFKRETSVSPGRPAPSGASVVRALITTVSSVRASAHEHQCPAQRRTRGESTRTPAKIIRGRAPSGSAGSSPTGGGLVRPLCYLVRSNLRTRRAPEALINSSIISSPCIVRLQSYVFGIRVTSSAPSLSHFAQ